VSSQVHLFYRPTLFAALVMLASPVSAADDSKTFRALSGPEARRLFEGLTDVQYPADAGATNSDPWSMSFQSNGDWEGYVHGGTSTEGFGTWHVEGDTLCVVIKGGSMEWNAPFEGCFGILISENDGTIAARFPELQYDRYTMKESAFGAITRLQPQAPADRIIVQADRTDTEKAKVLAQDDVQKRTLETQRLALERERLEAELKLSQMRLELQRQKQELEKQAQAFKQRQQPAVDNLKPIIQTTETIATTDGNVRIAGTARDDARLTRVEVGGRRVDVDGSTGRFSAEVPVQLGRNRIAITATDANGNKAERIVLVTRKRAIPDIAFGTYHAIVIGIDDYKSLPKLKTAVADARAVARTLKNDYGYTVHLLENPTRDDIIDKFDELRATLVEEDNLLIYYAGHGWRDEQSGRGYWLPRNARTDRRSRWFSNATLTDALQALLAKHVMVVADSCYSGTLTRSIKVPERNKAYIERMAEKRARVVLSSGGLEPVADSGGGDHSVFAAQFLKALKNNQGVLDGTQLFEKVRHKVVLNADQTPEYSDIRRAGHEGGDFLFVRKD
jgi:hypothetical protein